MEGHPLGKVNFTDDVLSKLWWLLWRWRSQPLDPPMAYKKVWATDLKLERSPQRELHRLPAVGFTAHIPTSLHSQDLPSSGREPTGHRAEDGHHCPICQLRADPGAVMKRQAGSAVCPQLWFWRKRTALLKTHPSSCPNWSSPHMPFTLMPAFSFHLFSASG